LRAKLAGLPLKLWTSVPSGDLDSQSPLEPGYIFWSQSKIGAHFANLETTILSRSQTETVILILDSNLSIFFATIWLTWTWCLHFIEPAIYISGS